MKYGYFDDENKEYVITRPDTPLPWINYLGSQDYIGLMSNTAGGYSFYKDARLRRLTRYRYNNVPTDTGGRYLYVRDRQDGEFWSPSWQPVRKELDHYECRHGLGYTRILSTYREIKTSTLYFVPLNENFEVWQITIENQRDTTAELDLFSLVEFALWDAQDDASNFQRNFNIGEVEVHDSVIYHKTEYRERRDHFAYFACSAPVSGFDTSREAFLGAYRGYDAPIVVEQGKAKDSIAHGWAPIGAHQAPITLTAGESKQITFILGYHENAEEEKWLDADKQLINKEPVEKLLGEMLNSERVEKEFQALAEHWADLLNIQQVKTPDEHTNRILNIWNPYQCMMTFNLSRSASLFESGVGRGMGFRDSNQDLLGFVHMVPERARERILDIAATQLEDGGAYHQYQPLTKRGNDAVGGGFNDDPLWLVLGVTAYIRETGDRSILEEKVLFDNQPGSEKSLLEHLHRSLQYTLDRIGPNELPLIGRADWNDCLNLNTFSAEPGESFQTADSKDGKVAESVFIAGLFVYAAKEMVDLLKWLGDEDGVEKYKNSAKKMNQVILGAGWDGEWFRRAYDNFGNPIGSKENEEGQIYIEPQGMCVLAGVGLDGGEAQQALDAVAKRLATEHGILLHQPAYTQYHLHIGEITSYPPGYKENASVFCHTNPWIMIAETILGRGDNAFSYYQRINPSYREQISETHRSEPYVYAQTIAGKDAPTFGEAKNSWLTGTAAWNYLAATQYILGIFPRYEGLQITPVIPSDWDGFQVTRRFRNVVCRIDVKRQGLGNEVHISVDGKAIDGQVIPLGLIKGKEQIKVDVLLGVKE